MAQSHDARSAELVADLGGDEVRVLFRDLVEKALQELIDAELSEATALSGVTNRDEDESAQRVSFSGIVEDRVQGVGLTRVKRTATDW